uniref:ATP-grasp domain-containing protein n=1 Tax=Archaeoglobus fulgidus TaxID=2234 RepID=A0A7C3MBP5_ARCFL
MPEKVLVAGNNVRNVAESAAKAGYEVYALTKFLDADLRIYCRKIVRIDGSQTEDEIRRKIEELAESLSLKIVLCSGFETFKVRGELLCNQNNEKVSNKLEFYRELERAGLPFPELLGDDEIGIVKPIKGGGGEEVKVSSRVEKGFLKQRFIDGIPCSVSLIACEGKAVPVACNFIYAGWKEMNASGFRYSGNLTPLVVKEETRKELERLAVEAVELFGLNGSVGVDFVLADKPYILEINPRFQGSLDSVEWSCDVNIFRMHADAFEGKLPPKPKPKRFALRSILFAPEKVKVRENLAGNPFFADVPDKGEIYQKNDPLVSILASGNSREEVEGKILERKKLFLSLAV